MLLLFYLFANIFSSESTCEIVGCTTCTGTGENEVCSQCDTSKHFVADPSNGGKQCDCDAAYPNLEDGECKASTTPSTCEIVGCTTCTGTGENEVCSQCDTSKHFVADPSNGGKQCDCDAAYPNLEDGECKASTTPSTCEIVGCTTCTGTGENEVCSQCDTSKHFVADPSNGGKQCDCDAAYPNLEDGECKASTTPSTCEIVGCTTCTGTGENEVCSQCDTSKHFVADPSNGGKQCDCDAAYPNLEDGECKASTTPSTCEIVGCTTCTGTGENEVCSQCDTSKHFVADPSNGGKQCDCDAAYPNLEDGECKASTTPSTCEIVGCTTCTGTGENEVCSQCDTSKHFVADPSNGGKQCDCDAAYPNLEDGECKASTTPSTCEIVGCTTCTGTGENEVCSQCDTSKHFVADPSNGGKQCDCDAAYPNLEDGECKASTTPSTCEIVGCTTCTGTGENEVCSQCDTSKHFVADPSNGGKQCDCDAAYPNLEDGECKASTTPSTCEIVGCTTCTGTGENEVCSQCDTSKHFVADPSNGGKQCDCDAAYPNLEDGECKASTTPSTCEIVGCTTCTGTGENEVCSQCDTSKHFVADPSNGGKQCDCDAAYPNLEDGECKASTTPSTCEIVGCTTCTGTGENEVCSQCDTSKHFVADPSNGGKQCDCDAAYPNLEDGECKASTTPSTCEIVGCTTCTGTGENEVCSQCDTSKHFVADPSNGGKQCDCDAAYPNLEDGECKASTTPSTCEIVGCTTCTGTGENEVCSQCDTSKHFVADPSNGGKQCDCDAAYPNLEDGECKASTTPSTCEIVGCTTCTGTGENEVCSQCDTSKHFVADPSNGGKQCDCDAAYPNLENGECKENSTPPSSKSCDYNILNCVECDPKDSSYCITCENGYGLQGGYCTKCGKDLYINSKSPCKLDCSAISNCAEFGSSYEYESNRCDIENGEFYCFKCEGDYEISDDYKTCIQKRFICSEYHTGCTKCNETTKECLECDANNHFVPDNDGGCDCDRKNGYDWYDDQCLLEEKCDESSNCEKCWGPNKLCSYCKTGYGLLNGKCNECTLKINDRENPPYNGAPCYVECSIENCMYCRDGETNECYRCKDGFDDFDGKCLEKCKDNFIRNENGQCVNATLVDCPNVWGCKKCPQFNMNYCAVCNDTFRKSRVHPGTCVCDHHHEYVDNKCVRPAGPYVPPPINKTELGQLSKESFTTSNSDDGLNYTLSKIEGVSNENQLYYPFGTDSGAVTIPDDFKNKEYFFDIQPRNKPFTIQLPPETVANVECMGDSTNLKIPADNKKVNLYGGGKVTLNPIGDENSLTLNNVILEPQSKNLVLDSDKSNLTLLILDITGDKECQGQQSTGNDVFQTTCNLVKVEARSEFTPKNIKLENIKVGLLSLINIDDTVNIENANIILYHNNNHYGNQRTPLVFSGSAPAKTGEIHIEKLDEGVAVPTEQENFSVAEFNLKNYDDSKKACDEMLKDFKGGDVFSEDSGKCVPDENDKNKAILVATREYNQNNDDDDKGGLSAGAIAGIVIACVVVVAAIIALLVYFLVIKKKNQSTTSTQGDSSIAI